MPEMPQTPPVPKKSGDVRLLFLVLCVVSLLLAVFLYRFDHPEEFRRSAEKVRGAVESAAKGIPVIFERIGDFTEYVLDYGEKPIETLPLVLPEKFEYADAVSDTGSTASEEGGIPSESSGSFVPPSEGVHVPALSVVPKAATATGIVIRVG